MNETTQKPSEHKAGKMHKSLIGIWKNLPPDNAAVIFNDATANREDLEALLGRSVIDITPAGCLANRKRVVQYPIDLTRHASPTRFLAVLRGILTEFPAACKVGLITHRPLIGALNKLGEPFAGRIVKSTYFGSGAGRASNDWHERCDLLIVLGTPRVPGEAVQRRLCQLGDFDSAGEDGQWGDKRWRVWTESGGRRIVKGKGYAHEKWSKSHASLVRAALIQAAGRGRPLLETGCDVAIVSTEWCGFDFIDHTRDIELSETEASVLAIISEITDGYRSLIDITKTSLSINDTGVDVPTVSTWEIANRLGLTRNGVQKILAGLESRLLVARIGQRGGWRLADGSKPVADVAETPAPAPAIGPTLRPWHEAGGRIGDTTNNTHA